MKLSPKYGLNPAITKCWWCGEDTGIALMGRINPNKKRGKSAEDLEAPKYTFGGYEPCEKCKQNWKLGAVLVEALKEPVFEGQPEIQQGVYPTGRHLVVKREWAKSALNLDSDKVFVDKELMEDLLQSIKE